MSQATESWRTKLTDRQVRYLACLWGKSGHNRYTKQQGAPTLLLQHLFDTLAVGEVLWDQQLSRRVRDQLDAVTNGDGRRFFAWICGVHDIGKCSPAFQSQDDQLRRAVEEAGLSINVAPRGASAWRHEKAGALHLRDNLSKTWQSPEMVEWVWPLVAGHHGYVPSRREFNIRRERPRLFNTLHGTSDSWIEAHDALLDTVTTAAGYRDLSEAEPAVMPNRALQLAIAGSLVMADWTASNSRVVEGVDTLTAVSLTAARARARTAVDALGFMPVSEFQHPSDTGDPTAAVGHPPRPIQRAMADAAAALPCPGIIVCEAPTGEGKTEAAFAAAEVLATRFGTEGVFVALPTQATSDVMFDRVIGWLNRLGSDTEVGLVHGGKARNEKWRALRELTRSPRSEPKVFDTDEYGERIEWDDFSIEPTAVGICEDCAEADGRAVSAASEWFDGRHRGLLVHNAVGTVDQLLFAGTRTKFVMVRYAGLAGKVVIIDEIHAVDQYMAVILGEVLAWLGLGGVPVMLLSATLAPGQRQDLIEQYLRGATSDPALEAGWASEVTGQPIVTTAWVENDRVGYRSTATRSWSEGHDIKLTLIDKQDDAAEINRVVDLLTERLVDGGCALVLRNTVARAQETFDRVRERFPDSEVVLLHGRLTNSKRAELTANLVQRLGPEAERPTNLIVVATQVAEQSFDVDVDLLVTDFAPLDLLIQRCGRMHRHKRDPGTRPTAVREPEMVLTGLDRNGDVPWFPRASEHIYSRHVLLRSLATLLPAIEEELLRLPDSAPELVAMCYSNHEIGPSGWHDAMTTAKGIALDDIRQRRGRAHQYVLVPTGERSKATLEGLHDYSAGGEDHIRVRDSDMGAEITLVVRDGEGFRTLGGSRLGVNGELLSSPVSSSARERLLRDVVGDTVRLPGGEGHRATTLNRAAGELGSLPEWRDHPLLGGLHVLVLDETHTGSLAGYGIRYDDVRGLEVGTVA